MRATTTITPQLNRTINKKVATPHPYGFNGMEKDDEVKGANNSLDFGARIYDNRIGRWLSRDPLEGSYPYNTPYSFAANSPITFIDKYGKHPKIAIILYDPDRPNEFNDHKEALEKVGYEVIYAQSGEHILNILASNTTKESPVENFILLSHASPGGPNNQHHSGLYTDAEIEEFARLDWEDKIMIEEISGSGVVTDSESSDFDDLAWSEAVDQWYADNPEEVLNKKWEDVKDEEVSNYKKNTKSISTSDFGIYLRLGTSRFGGGIQYKSDLKVVIGGCNASGYCPKDDQVIFTTDLAKNIGGNVKVYGAQGYTEPIHESTKRNADCNWVETDGAGNAKSTGSSQIDLANP